MNIFGCRRCKALEKRLKTLEDELGLIYVDDEDGFTEYKLSTSTYSYDEAHMNGLLGRIFTKLKALSSPEEKPKGK